MDCGDNNRKRTRNEYAEDYEYSDGYSSVMSSQDNCDNSNKFKAEPIPCNSFQMNSTKSGLHTAKKVQQGKIHTELHQKTVAMMMEASWKLSQTTPAEETPVSDPIPVIETYTQRPYW